MLSRKPELRKLDHRQRRGAMLVLVAAVLVILLIGAVFSVDVAYMHMVRAELHAATDAAARAGSETLARTQNRTQAVNAAINIANQNNVAGDGLSLDTADVQVGGVKMLKSGRFEYVDNQQPYTAIRVNGKRDAGSLDGQVNLFFARLFGADQFAPTELSTAAASVRDVALVLDVSGSMGTDTGGGVTRLGALKQAVRAFFDEIKKSSPTTQVSLTVYSSYPSKLEPLTLQYAKVKNKVDVLLEGGMTAIGDALLVGSDSLIVDANQRDYAAKTVVVMTDGNHNTGPSPIDTVTTAVSRGHQVHTVTFSSGANQTLMKDVAAAANGMHIHADSAGDLSAAFREIARTLAVTLIE